jgi:Ku70/Ku80 beta-barrel domain
MPDPHLSGDEPIGTDFAPSPEPENSWSRQHAPHEAEIGEELERSELVRGYEASKSRYVVLTEDELEAIDIELSRTLDLTLVDLSEVDVVYLDTPYYVVPDDKIGDETFIVLREAMVKPISNSAKPLTNPNRIIAAATYASGRSKSPRWERHKRRPQRRHSSQRSVGSPSGREWIWPQSRQARKTRVVCDILLNYGSLRPSLPNEAGGMVGR